MKNYFKDLKYFFLIFITLSVAVFFASKGFTLSKSVNNQPIGINKLLNNVHIGPAETFRNMTIYPLVAKTAQGDQLLLLDEATGNGTIEIKERGAGDVNNLELQKNSSKYPVFLMAGEIVKGAKQDRIIKNDILLDKDYKQYTIAVYCVEQGRWVKQSDKFESAGVMGANKLRSTVVQGKSQSEVWSEVAKKNKSLDASSSTSNYRASYESSPYKDEAESYISHFISLSRKNPNYVGVIVEVNNKVSNLDVFGDHDTFSSLWPKLIKAYSQDAVDDNFISGLPRISSASSFFNSLKYSDLREVSNPGIGNEYSIIGDQTAGNMLTYNNNIIHLALFADAGGKTYINDDQREQNYQQIPDLIRHR